MTVSAVRFSSPSGRDPHRPSRRRPDHRCRARRPARVRARRRRLGGDRRGVRRRARGRRRHHPRVVRADEGPLHRPQLPRPRGGVRARHPGAAGRLREVAELRWSAPGQSIVLPPEEKRPDYEAELGIVFSRRSRAPRSRTRARRSAAYCAFHDVSGRQYQLETPLRQFVLGKSFDTFGPMGPLVNADGVDLNALDVRGTVSGEVMQSSNTRNFIFNIEQLIVVRLDGDHHRGGRRARSPARPAASATARIRSATWCPATWSRSRSRARRSCATRWSRDDARRLVDCRWATSTSRTSRTSCPTAARCCTRCRSASATARRRRCSARTAPARRRCCG